MQKKVVWKPGQSYLFVCFGNTCRSPMAEGLAKKIFQGRLVIESAGISNLFETAQPEAVDVMQERYGVDISGHITREVNQELLRRFDGIIVLDAYVLKVLKTRYPQCIDRTYLWEIDDPYGRPRRAYEKTARSIAHAIDRFMAISEWVKESI